MTVYGFNLRRASVLNRVADREGLAPRTKGGKAGYPGTLPDTAGMFVAKVPDPGGIPAAAGTTPGTANCDIYKLGSGSTLEDQKFEQTVYNIYAEVPFVAEFPYIRVVQDRFGRWYNDPPVSETAGMHVARVPTGGIPARSGLTPGTATVDIFHLDALGNLENTLETQEVNNIYATAFVFDSDDPYIRVFKNEDDDWFTEDPLEEATTTAELIHFRLYDNLNLGGNALARLLTFDAVNNQYVDGAQIRVFDWWGQVVGGLRGMWQAAATMRGWAFKRTNKRFPTNPEDEYDIVFMEVFARTLNFLTTGEQAGFGWNATNVNSWDGVDPGNDIEVFQDDFNLGGGARFDDVIEDCIGTASRSEYKTPNLPALPFYQIISSQRAARAGLVKAQYDFTKDNAPVPDVPTWTIDMFGDFAVDPGCPEQANIRNHLKLSGKAGDFLYLVRTDMAPPFVWLLLGVQSSGRADEMVQIVRAGHANGDIVTAQGSGYHDSQIMTWNDAGALEAGEQVWLRFVEWESLGDNGGTLGEVGRTYNGTATGKKVSVEGAEPAERPLFLCDIGEQTFLGQPVANIAKGASGSVRIYNGDETDSGITLTAKALGFPVVQDKWVPVNRFRGGSWYVGCWEV